LGSQTYDKSELVALLAGGRASGDASLALGSRLVAAKLNVANGADPGPVNATIADADTLLSNFSGKLPYNVKRSSSAGQAMAADAKVLTSYNHGALTSGCGP
jgi:hypothetical protein